LQDARALDKRITSHDFGMVGFVKSLVDEVPNIGPSMNAPIIRSDRLEAMHVYKQAVVLKKRYV
jgi:hypothetical protein